MKYVDEFRSPQIGAAIIQEIISKATKLNRHIKIMEVCGGHTHAIFKYGIESSLPANIELIHGPGCPVCIMPKGRLDEAIYLAQQPQVILTTFGDVMRVPGSQTTLMEAKAAGADIRMVYSPLDSLEIAKANPNREVVFFAIGFETTAPSTALTVLQAKQENIPNFSLFSNHVLVVPALQALLNNPDLELDGFIGPGHVSMVIGTDPYEFIPHTYNKPVVVAGFEPLDILQATSMLVQQIIDGRVTVENQYHRLVEPAGNPVALAAMEEVFATRNSFEWRGLGEIPQSGLQIHPNYADFDAECKFNIPPANSRDHRACACGQILTGVLKPWQCKVFGTACTPENPLGACMVSSEGACAAYYKYAGVATNREDRESQNPAVIALRAMQQATGNRQ